MRAGCSADSWGSSGSVSDLHAVPSLVDPRSDPAVLGTALGMLFLNRWPGGERGPPGAVSRRSRGRRPATERMRAQRDARIEEAERRRARARSPPRAPRAPTAVAQAAAGRLTRRAQSAPAAARPLGRGRPPPDQAHRSRRSRPRTGWRPPPRNQALLPTSMPPSTASPSPREARWRSRATLAGDSGMNACPPHPG